jgi:hypothetical protein
LIWSVAEELLELADPATVAVLLKINLFTVPLTFRKVFRARSNVASLDDVGTAPPDQFEAPDQVELLAPIHVVGVWPRAMPAAATTATTHKPAANRETRAAPRLPTPPHGSAFQASVFIIGLRQGP